MDRKLNSPIYMLFRTRKSATCECEAPSAAIGVRQIEYAIGLFIPETTVPDLEVKALGIQQMVTLAAWLYRTGDQHHSTRVPGSQDRIQRALFVPTPFNTSSTTFIDAERTWLRRKTVRSPDRSNSQMREESSRFRRWVGSLIVTTGAPPELLPRQSVLGCYLHQQRPVCFRATA
jgi:hypothetical protein